MNADNPSWRPALILGLGGSGTKILRYLQWLSRHSGDTELCDRLKKQHLQLQAFDTSMDANETSQPIESMVTGGSGTMAHAAFTKTQELELLDPMHLLKRESIPETIRTILNDELRELDSNALNSSQQEKEEEHIRAWLPNFEIEPNEILTPAQAEGGAANQYRPLGRIALFKDAEKIYSLIHRRLVKLKACTPSNQKMQIHLVSSLAGGTGGGMYWDIAFLVHKAMEELKRSFDIHASLLLPGPFQLNSKDSRTVPNTYAGLIELAALKNVRRKTPLKVIYPSGERLLKFVAKPRDVTLFRSVFLYDALPPCEDVRDEKSALQESTYCRVAENLIAHVHADINRAIQIGRDNISTDSNASHSEVESTYVFSTSTTLALDDQNNQQLTLGLIRFCYDEFNTQLGLRILDKTTQKLYQQTLGPLVLQWKEKTGLEDLKGSKQIAKYFEAQLFQHCGILEKPDHQPRLLGSLLDNLSMVINNAKDIRTGYIERHKIHERLRKTYEQLDPKIINGWQEAVLDWNINENNIEDSQNEPEIIANLGRLFDFRGGVMAPRPPPIRKLNNNTRRSLFDEYWSGLRSSLDSINNKLDQSFLAISNDHAFIYQIKHIKSLIDASRSSMHKPLVLQLTAPAEFHQLRYELNVLAKGEEDSEAYKQFIKYPPSLDTDLSNIFIGMLINIREQLIVTFHHLCGFTDESPLTSQARQLLLTEFMASPQAKKVSDAIETLLTENTKRITHIENRQFNLKDELGSADLLTNEDQINIQQLMGPLEGLLTGEMNPSSELLQREKKSANDRRKHHAKQLAHAFQSSIKNRKGLESEVLRCIDRGRHPENGEAEPTTLAYGSQETLESILLTMAESAASEQSNNVSKTEVSNLAACDFAKFVLCNLKIIDEKNALQPKYAYIDKLDHFEALKELIKLQCTKFSDYWINQASYAVQRLGGKQRLEEKLRSVNSEIFTVGMASRTIQTENLVITLPRRSSSIHPDDHKKTRIAIEKTLKKAAERVLGMSPEFVDSNAKHAMIYYEEAFRPGRQIRGVRSYYDAYNRLSDAKKRNSHFYFDDSEPYPHIVPTRQVDQQGHRINKDCAYCTPVNHLPHSPRPKPDKMPRGFPKLDWCSTCNNTMTFYDKYLDHNVDPQGKHDAAYCPNLYACNAGQRVWNTYSSLSDATHCKCCPDNEPAMLLPRDDLQANIESCPICLKILGLPETKGQKPKTMKNDEEILDHFEKKNLYSNLDKNDCCPSCATRPAIALLLLDSTQKNKTPSLPMENSQDPQPDNAADKSLETYLRSLRKSFATEFPAHVLELPQIMAKNHNNHDVLSQLLNIAAKPGNDEKMWSRVAKIDFEELEMQMARFVVRDTYSGEVFFRRLAAIAELAKQQQLRYEDTAVCANRI